MTTGLFELKKMILPEVEALAREEGFADAAGACIATVCGFSEIARKDGLLSMEVMFSGQKEDWIDREFREYACTFNEAFPLTEQLNLLLVDGTEPEVVFFIGSSSVLRETDAGKRLIKLMILTGFLYLQAGTHPYVIGMLLLSMLPEAVQDQAKAVMKQHGHPETRRRICRSETLKGHMVEVLSYEERDRLLAETCVEKAGEVRELEQMMEHMEDRSVQRLLRDVDNRTLVHALMLLSVSAREKILDNLSPRLREMIVEDLSAEMQEIQMRACAKAAAEDAGKILGVLKRLKAGGEIL